MVPTPAAPVLRLVVLCPHFAPDTAPTGHVMTRIVGELAARGHEVHVVTALPWYRDHRVEAGWAGRWMRIEEVPWGSITRVHPFPGSDRRDLVRRAAGFAGFSLLAGFAGLRAGGWFRRADAVIAMSPPLTLGLTGWAVGRTRRAPLVFNIQDVFPDAAIETGAITDPRIAAVASWLERLSYRRAAAVTVLSDDLADNVRAKLPGPRRDRVHVIPNFVLTDELSPGDRMTAYRRELGIGAEPVVLYAGNVGFSQSLDLVVHAARELPGVTFLVNGEGAARAELEAAAADLPNVRFGAYQPADRLNELLATGDVHVVPLRRGLGRVSVPSKTYSILAAGRPVVAAIDPDTEVPRMLAASGGGVAVGPDDPSAFVGALRDVLERPDLGASLGAAGRRWVESSASPAAVAASYEALVTELRHRRRVPFGRGPFRGAHR
ncbi:MAG: glycosyltransferase family 4 protein [Ilumatobacteraceae bacterium]